MVVEAVTTVASAPLIFTIFSEINPENPEPFIVIRESPGACDVKKLITTLGCSCNTVTITGLAPAGEVFSTRDEVRELVVVFAVAEKYTFVLPVPDDGVTVNHEDAPLNVQLVLEVIFAESTEAPGGRGILVRSIPRD